MHIVYVIAPGGGPDAYVKTISPWLVRHGHQVSVVYSGVSPFPPQLPAGVDIHFAPLKHGHYYLGKITGQYRLLALRFRSMELSRAVKYVIGQIHRTHPVDAVEMTEGYVVKGISKRWAVVIRAHGSDWAFRHFCKDGDTKWDSLVIKTQAEQFQNAHVVSPLSRQYSEYLSEVCRLPRGMFQELPYPIDTDRFSPAGGLEPEIAPNSMMTIGRLEHRKGSDIAVQAMNHVWKFFPDARLYLLGGEAQFTRGELANLADEKHRSQIVFPGFVDHTRLPFFYRAVKTYFAPTQYETFGYTILEALACGVPVTACPAGAVPELVEDGVNGSLVPFGDARAAAQAITEMLSNGEKRELMGVKARETALQYSLDIVGQKHIQMYEQARSAFSKTPSGKTGQETS